MLKKLPLLMFALVFLMGIGQSYAQEGTVTGTVIDSTTSETLPGASILIEELGTGATTDSEGNFTMENVPVGTYMITASFVGYDQKSVEVEVTEGTNMVNFSIVPSTYGMEDVVVTAYGIEQEMNELPYSAQSVSGEKISQNRNDNFLENLSGRVAGLRVDQSNQIGGSTNIIMRGYSSISGNNQALIVVDGVPYANQEFNDAAAEAGFAGADYGNTGIDVDPDNIKSVNVLKGPAAAALYGERAANGAIVVETKSGEDRGKQVDVTFNSSVGVKSVNANTFPDYQMDYGAGYYGVEDYIYSGFGLGGFHSIDVDGDGTQETASNYFDDASYGPRFDSDREVYQWDAFDSGNENFMTPTPWTAPDNKPIDFFETGVNISNSISFNGGFDGGYYNLSYSQSNNTGILPNSELDKNKLSFGAGYDVSDRLTVKASAQYSKVEGLARPRVGYSTVMSEFRQWWATNVDIQKQHDAYFRDRTNATWNWADGGEGERGIYWNNPYWQRYENYSTDERNRLFGYTEANFEVFEWLNLTGRVSVDSYSQLIEERNNVGSVGHGSGYATRGYVKQTQDFAEFNYDLLANYNTQLNKDLGLSGVVGMNIRRNHRISTNARTNGGLTVPDVFSLDNSLNEIPFPTEIDRQLGVNGYFASVNFNYGDFLTLELTGRRDKSSSLPDGENVYYYPSVSAGFIFSEFLDSEVISFGKVRASWAEVGNTAPPHSIRDTYSRRTNFGSAGLYSVPSTKNNTELKPERTKSWEVGLQMRLFGSNRFTYDVNYYKQNTTDQILSTEVSRASGYSSKFVNAGNVENRGFEVTVTGRPVVNPDFTWIVEVNWTKNTNEVKELAEGITNYQLASPQGAVSISAAEGEPYGAIRGTAYLRYDENADNPVAPDNSGEPVVNPNSGFYQATSTANNIIGNMNPDWTGGISNRINYKNWSLNFLIDVRKGGDIFSLDQYYGQGTGLYPITAGENDLGNPKRLPVSEGGGVVLDGVLPNGDPNDVRAETGSVLGAYGYVNNPSEHFIYDGTYVKLRELGLTYHLPQDFVGQTNILSGASLSANGRNLWIIHKNLPHADPEQSLTASNVQGYSGGQYPAVRNITFNLKLEF